MVLHALNDETVQRVIGLVMGLPLEDVRAGAEEIGAAELAADVRCRDALKGLISWIDGFKEARDPTTRQWTAIFTDTNPELSFARHALREAR